MHYIVFLAFYLPTLSIYMYLKDYVIYSDKVEQIN